MLKKLSCVAVVLLLMAVIPACEPPDDETVAKVITSATSVAFSQILECNPQIEETLYMYAIMQKQAIVERTINAELANAIFNKVIESCPDLDADDKQRLVMLFSTILPMIEIPEEGMLSERSRKFMVAFLDGIINVIEMNRAIEGSGTNDTTMMEPKVQFLMETLNGLYNPSA